MNTDNDPKKAPDPTPTVPVPNGGAANASEAPPTNVTEPRPPASQDTKKDAGGDGSWILEGSFHCF